MPMTRTLSAEPLCSPADVPLCGFQVMASTPASHAVSSGLSSLSENTSASVQVGRDPAESRIEQMLRDALNTWDTRTADQKRKR